jgi:hypothetical protein
LLFASFVPAPMSFQALFSSTFDRQYRLRSAKSTTAFAASVLVRMWK